MQGDNKVSSFYFLMRKRLEKQDVSLINWNPVFKKLKQNTS